jgi:hypothetical protein
MIIIREFTEEKWPLYCSNNELIGYVDVFQYNDARIQIKEQKLSGYYILFGDDKLRIDITSSGKAVKHPNGFFDTYNNQLMKIIHDTPI